MLDAYGNKMVYAYEFQILGSKNKRYVGRVWVPGWFPDFSVKGVDYKCKNWKPYESVENDLRR